MKFILSLLFVFSFFISFSQEREIKGQVRDSLKQPVVFANLMAETINAPDIPPVFAMSGEDGSYKIRLLKKISYQITVLSMGYEKYVFRVDSLSGDLEKNIVLKEAKNQLDEVVITADMPVKVTQDSIVYKTDRFKTGEERKLKDVLKKLPGVEVSKTGQVTVMGKKVSKVLVEGKEFFGGGTKLAVENIPADAVDKVTAVDDYHSISFMQGLTDEQKMIINIKLKEGKKRFVFGDIYAGAGDDEKYSGKANLFYYSPKTNLSYIGNINNTGEASMDISDFMRFEGSSMSLDKMRSSFRNFNSISSLIFQDQFISKEIHFQAAQWQQDVGPKHEFSTYMIYDKDRQTAGEDIHNEYLETGIEEIRNTSQQQDFETAIGKVHWRYKKEIFDYLDLNLSGNWQNQKNLSGIANQYESVDRFINKTGRKENFYIDGIFTWHKRFNKKNTLRVINEWKHSKETPEDNWTTNDGNLNPLLPLETQAVYEINQNREIQKNQWYAELKHYWIIDNKQHIYTTLGNDLMDGKLDSYVYQILENGQSVSFESAGFTDDMHLKINDLFGGLQYKRKMGKFVLKTGLFAHSYRWNFKNLPVRTKFNLLPEFRLERKYSLAKKIVFNYQLKSSIYGLQKYSGAFYLREFSSVYRGNPALENELFHQLSLSINNYSFIKKHQYYLRFQYRRKLNPIKDKVVYTDIYSYYQAAQLSMAEDFFSSRLFYKLDLRRFYVKLTPAFSYGRYMQNIQENWKEIKNFTQNYKLSFGTYFKKWPNMDFGVDYNHSATDYGNLYITNKKISPFFELEYDFLKHFVFSGSYEYQINYDTNNRKKDFQKARFTLSYQKENNPWGFELKAKNIFNTSYIQDIIYGPYMITTQNIYRQPSVWLLVIHYKL